MLTLIQRSIPFYQPLHITSNAILSARLLSSIGTTVKTKSFYDQIIEALEAVRATKKDKADTYKSRYNGRVKKDFSSEGNPEKRANFNPENRLKLKKWCVLLAYSGANYFGMQRNPGMKTIEEELLVAMLKHKWITETGFKLPLQIQFQRASRTDKGVSAARQCVSMKLPDDLATDLSDKLAAINQDLPPEIQIFGVKRVTKGFNSKEQCDARTYTYTLPTISFADHGEDVTMENYRLTTEKFDRLNSVLKMFLGTKNHHNFTSQKQYADPSANRFIVSFTCSQPFVDSTTNIEFAVLKVKGQSFMLHQIRKMIGLTLAIIRGFADANTIMQRAFTPERIDVPKCPGLGLVLDQTHYDRYNAKYGTDGMHEALEWSAEEEKIQQFFDQRIFPTIVKTEMTEKSMVNWLETLPMHSYDGDAKVESNVVADEPLTGVECNAVDDDSTAVKNTISTVG